MRGGARQGRFAPRHARHLQQARGRRSRDNEQRPAAGRDRCPCHWPGANRGACATQATSSWEKDGVNTFSSPKAQARLSQVATRPSCGVHATIASSALSICDEEQEAADALSAVPVVVLELEAELVKEDVSGPHCIKSLRGTPAQVSSFTSRGRRAVGVKGASRASWGKDKVVILTPAHPRPACRTGRRLR